MKNNIITTLCRIALFCFISVIYFLLIRYVTNTFFDDIRQSSTAGIIFLAAYVVIVLPITLVLTRKIEIK